MSDTLVLRVSSQTRDAAVDACTRQFNRYFGNGKWFITDTDACPAEVLSNPGEMCVDVRAELIFLYR